jgi:hypothetical protein
MLIGMFQDQLLQVMLLQARNVMIAPTDVPPLPRPMIENNHEAKTVCWRDDALKEVAVTAAVRHPINLYCLTVLCWRHVAWIALIILLKIFTHIKCWD